MEVLAELQRLEQVEDIYIKRATPLVIDRLLLGHPPLVKNGVAIEVPITSDGIPFKYLRNLTLEEPIFLPSTCQCGTHSSLPRHNRVPPSADALRILRRSPGAIRHEILGTQLRTVGLVNCIGLCNCNLLKVRSIAKEVKRYRMPAAAR